MVNYENTKIYKIWSPSGPKIYVGSTTKEMLCQRMVKHRENYKVWKNGKHGKTSSFELFEEYGVENCFIELLEAKSCENKDELNKLESKYIRELDCINKVIPDRQRTNNEYYQDNKVAILERSKVNNREYRQKNIEKLHEKFTCECGGHYTYETKRKHIKRRIHLDFFESRTD